MLPSTLISFLSVEMSKRSIELWLSSMRNIERLLEMSKRSIELVLEMSKRHIALLLNSMRNIDLLLRA